MHKENEEQVFLCIEMTTKKRRLAASEKTVSVKTSQMRCITFRTIRSWMHINITERKHEREIKVFQLFAVKIAEKETEKKLKEGNNAMPEKK